MRQWFSMGDVYDILYDRKCGLCRASKRMVESLGTLSELRFHDLNDPRVVGRFAGIDPVKVHQSMHVIDSVGRISAGYDAVVVLLAQTHLLHPLRHLLRRPRIARLGRRLYGYVARHRHELFG